jgi:uncharacterized membrane protein
VNVGPPLEASIAVQLHVATVLLGKAFLALMIVTSIISFFVHERRPDSPLFGLSPIHVLAAFVLFASWRAYSTVKKKDIATHRMWMLGIYTGSLVINGAMNVFVVDGITRDVFFGG